MFVNKEEVNWSLIVSVTTTLRFTLEASKKN